MDIENILTEEEQKWVDDHNAKLKDCRSGDELEALLHDFEYGLYGCDRSKRDFLFETKMGHNRVCTFFGWGEHEEGLTWGKSPKELIGYLHYSTYWSDKDHDVRFENIYKYLQFRMVDVTKEKEA